MLIIELKTRTHVLCEDCLQLKVFLVVMVMRQMIARVYKDIIMVKNFSMKVVLHVHQHLQQVELNCSVNHVRTCMYLYSFSCHK